MRTLKKLSVYVMTAMMLVGTAVPVAAKAPAVIVTSATRNTSTKKDSKDYYELLMKATDSKELISYIKKNIKTASKKQIDEYMRGLFSFEDDIRNINVQPLLSVKKYLPEDVQKALPILIKEYKTPSLEDGTPKIKLRELLERATAYETYLNTYKSGTGAKIVDGFYKELLHEAITGGYNKDMGMPNIYMNNKETKVSDVAIDTYNSFIKAHKGTKTAKVIYRYVKLLEKTDGKITKRVNNFYEELYRMI